MRKPKTASSTHDDSPVPAGGRALGRARQFALSRGLPPPAAEAPADPRPRKPRKASTP